MPVRQLGISIILDVALQPSVALADDARFEAAKEQAEAFAPVLGGVRACDDAAADEVYLEFMRAKRRQGLDDQQTAFLGAFVGAMESRPAGEAVDCSDAGTAARAAQIERLRATW